LSRSSDLIVADQEDFDRGIDEIPTPAEPVKITLRKALFSHHLTGTEPAVVHLVREHLERARDVLDRCLFSEIPGLNHQIFVLLGKVAAELRTPRLIFRSEKDFRYAAAHANWPERLIEQALFLARGDWTRIEGITEAHVTIKGSKASCFPALRSRSP